MVPHLQPAFLTAPAQVHVAMNIRAVHDVVHEAARLTPRHLTNLQLLSCCRRHQVPSHQAAMM